MEEYRIAEESKSDCREFRRECQKSKHDYREFKGVHLELTRVYSDLKGVQRLLCILFVAKTVNRIEFYAADTSPN